LGSFGAQRAYQAALQLEELGGATDVTGCQHAFPELEEAVKRLQEGLADLLRGTGAVDVDARGGGYNRKSCTGDGRAAGYRESEQSWKELLLDVRARGLDVEASLAICDGALGFWKAMRQVWGTTREQRCWVHKTSNVLHHFRAQWPTRQIGLKRKAFSRSVLSAICFPNPRAETGRWMSVPPG
jgi:Transposase, Mutator family